MKRYVWTFIILFAFIEVYSVRPHAPTELDPAAPGIKHFLSGAVHVYSPASDGGSDIPEIAEEAKRAGLEFVVVTDINSATARPQEGRYNGVDVFVEMEVTTAAGRMLTFYSHTPLAKESDAHVAQLAWQHMQGKAEVPGLFNVIAHPSHPRYPWNALDRIPEGVEVFNFDSFWRKTWDHSAIRMLLTLFTYPLSNFLAANRFVQDDRQDLTAWDAMNAITPGRFGILAEHSRNKVRVTRDVGFRWPRHEQAFKVGSNVLFFEPPLAQDFAQRKKQIYELIRSGRSAMAFPFLHSFPGNDWKLECPEGTYRSGDQVTPQGKCEFVLHLPEDLDYPSVLRLWKSGELYKEVTTIDPVSRFPLAGPGVYRLEVWLSVQTLFRLLLSGEVPYLFYNPIYVH